MQSHEHYMRRALELAARGTGCTSPNPLVGSIVVRDGVVLGEGWHEVYGQAHAEANAISRARHTLAILNADSATKAPHDYPLLEGATIYVTLEPCNHQGATPPCTHAIVAAGIKHVIYALVDPNPKAAGGADWLRSQGVSVTQGVLEEEARFINRFFLKFVNTHRPYVIAKSASSLDGKTATRTGHSQWITGPASRQRGHELRQAVDAIIVGANTVIADDPSLTVRLPESLCANASVRHPRPVILDSGGRVSLNAKLLNGSLPTKALVLTTKAMDLAHRHAIESKGHDVIVLEKNTNGIGLSPDTVVDILGQLGLHSVLLEGGASVHGSFRDTGLIDEVWTFIAPTIIGGSHAPAAFAATGSDTLVDATQLHDIQLEQVGDDILIRGCVSPVSTNDQR